MSDIFATPKNHTNIFLTQIQTDIYTSKKFSLTFLSRKKTVTNLGNKQFLKHQALTYFYFSAPFSFPIRFIQGHPHTKNTERTMVRTNTTFSRKFWIPAQPNIHIGSDVPEAAVMTVISETYFLSIL